MLKVVSMQSCFDTSLFIRGVYRSTNLAWRTKIFSQHVFLVHSKTILEVNKIFVKFHCLSLYRSDLH